MIKLKDLLKEELICKYSTGKEFQKYEKHFNIIYQ